MMDPARVPRTRISAAILAGGEAARFGGRPKGRLELPGGRSIIEREIAELSAAGVRHIGIFTSDPRPYAHVGCEVVPDRRSGIGPLGGIETALLHHSGRCDAVLILPCDLPAITSREIAALIHAFHRSRADLVVAQTDPSLLQPLCALVRTSLRPAITQAITQGRRKVGALWRSLGAHPLHFDDPTPFFNINTPEDWERWRSQSPRGAPASPTRTGVPAPSPGGG
jgi:molybdopterin-guanine dinucleotide biosynthesis protein A